MKHIMYKKVYQAAMAALMLTAATACTGDNDPMQDNDTPQAGRLLTVTATQPGADTQTRITHQEIGNNVNVNWKAGDVIYIGKVYTVTSSLPLTEAGYVAYTLATGENSKNATFTSTDPLGGLADNTPIYAFYGKAAQMKTSAYSNKQILFYLGYGLGRENQRQTENGSMEHIADYDFMYATGTYKQGRITNFEFKHVASLMKFDLTLPREGITVKQLRLSSVPEFQYFLAETRKFTFSTQSIDYGGTSNITLNLGIDDNGFTCNGNKLTAYMMMHATKAQDFIVTVTDTNNKQYVSEALTSSPTDAGKFYTLRATLNENSN